MQSQCSPQPYAYAGEHVKLRCVRIEDASFILSLRCDAKKTRFLHHTEYNVDKQVAYIKSRLALDNEWYFIIEDLVGNSIGTYRVYDLREDSFSIGSWLLVVGASSEQAMESDYFARMFGFEHLGFEKCHFDVSRGNNKVLRYHLLMGAKISRETADNFVLECTKDSYCRAIGRYLGH